jgi:integrase/recombinase XerD
MENSGKQNPKMGFKSPPSRGENSPSYGLLQIRSTSGLKADISADMPWERSIGKASASKLKIYAKKDGRYQMSWYEQAGKRHVATRGTLAGAKSFQTQKIAELQRHRETKFDSEDRQMYSEARELALDHGCTVLQANSAGRGMSDLVIIGKQTLTAAQYSDLADVPPELEWLANITNGKTRRFYKSDVEEFLIFTGLRAPAELRTVTRAHVIAWRKSLEARQLMPASIRRKLSALSSLLDYLCERNAFAGNPVDGVKRPPANGNEGSTPYLGDAQDRRLLEAPAPDTLKGVRDRAILATLLYHGIRREELCLLSIRDMQSREGVMHFRIHGKRSKIRFVPVHPMAQRLIEEYFAWVKYGAASDGSAEEGSGFDGPIFRPVKNTRTGILDKHLESGSVYRNIVRKYGHDIGINAEVNGLCAFATGNGGDERPLARAGHRQGPGMAWARQRLHYPPLPPAQKQTGGQGDVSCKILDAFVYKVSLPADEENRMRNRQRIGANYKGASPKWL